VIFIIVFISWNNKNVFDTIDVRCKHEDIYILLSYTLTILRFTQFVGKGRKLSFAHLYCKSSSVLLRDKKCANTSNTASPDTSVDSSISSSSSYSPTDLSVWSWLPLQLMPIPLYPMLSFSIDSHRGPLFQVANAIYLSLFLLGGRLPKSVRHPLHGF